MPWQGGPELLLWHQISSSFSASFSSSWRQCRPQDPSHWNRTEIYGILLRLISEEKKIMLEIYFLQSAFKQQPRLLNHRQFQHNLLFIADAKPC